LPPAAERAPLPAAEQAPQPDRARPVRPELRALSVPPRYQPARSQPVQPQPVQPQPEADRSARPEPPQPPETASAQPAAGARPHRTANLSVADLDRVRQALHLLSEQTDTASAPATTNGDTASPRAALGTAGGDDDDTAPLPVILPGATAAPRPEELEPPRGPFEPARVAASASVETPAPPDAALPAPEAAAAPEADNTAIPAEAEAAEAAETLSPGAAEKLDQIKDLLITAEAIGEVNLDRHFDRVSKRQRELIREFFERAIPGRDPES
jgi:hypothetical protein